MKLKGKNSFNTKRKKLNTFLKSKDIEYKNKTCNYKKLQYFVYVAAVNKDSFLTIIKVSKKKLTNKSIIFNNIFPIGRN